MHQFAALFTKRLMYGGVRMSEITYRNARQGVQITLAVDIPKPSALSALKGYRLACISGHNMSRHSAKVKK
jgi:hypothetical protein